MAQRPRSVRLVLALSVAAVLAVFLLYVSIAGGRTAQFAPSELAGHKGNVSLVGKVVGPVQGAGYAKGGLRFRVRDVKGTAACSVVYRGSVSVLEARPQRDTSTAATYAAPSSPSRTRS